MKRSLLQLLLLCSLHGTRGAQELPTVTITLTETPLTHRGEKLFLACPLNGWSPNSPTHELGRDHLGRPNITLTLPKESSDILEFKITRGDWKRSECSTFGRLGEPHRVDLSNTREIECSVDGWRDDFPASTASPNVRIVSEEFPMPGLDRKARVTIYLPADYADSGKRYPVLYMQDGQHLFDEQYSEGRMGPIEWGVDEFLDQNDLDLIVVGIDHHPIPAGRVAEYLFHPGADCAYPRGEAYLTFLTEHLKPYIDTHYRTATSVKSTGIAGSSMGGMFSLYAGIRRPDVFGFAGVLSPSLWSDNGHLEREIARRNDLSAYRGQHYYFYAGGLESRRLPEGREVRMTHDTQQASALLETSLKVETRLEIQPEGRHNALSWRAAFPKVVEFFLL